MNANLKKPSSQWKFVIFQENVVTVVGHRGFPRKFPDNTLAGFAAAFEIVGMVETDIRRSLDGLLVLSHDPEIDDRVVAETSWAEISEIDLGFGQNPMLLDDALSALPGHSWNLEVKNFPGEPGFEDHLDLAIETARRAGDGDLVSSFYWPNVDRIRVEMPMVATGLLLEQGMNIVDALEHAREKGHVAIIPEWTMILENPRLVVLANTHGIGVATWTVNDPAAAIRLAEAGVSAIITDDPELILETL